MLKQISYKELNDAFECCEEIKEQAPRCGMMVGMLRHYAGMRRCRFSRVEAVWGVVRALFIPEVRPR